MHLCAAQPITRCRPQRSNMLGCSTNRGPNLPAAGLYAMARQFRMLRHQPTALQLPYEVAQAAFNDTMEQIAGHFWPQVR